MWLLKVHGTLDPATQQQVRLLRLHIMRLHAEHECLRIVLHNIMDQKIAVEPRSNCSDELQSYLKQATKRIGILESKSNKNYNYDIIEIARASMDVLKPGQRDAMSNMLDRLGLRKNILDNTLRYVDQWVTGSESLMPAVTVHNLTLNGDVISVGDIQNSNSVAIGRNAFASAAFEAHSKG